MLVNNQLRQTATSSLLCSLFTTYILRTGVKDAELDKMQQLRTGVLVGARLYRRLGSAGRRAC